MAGVDRMDALRCAVKAVRRGGTVSISGVYGGEVDPMPMMEMFDRGVQLRMGQAHVKRWVGELMPIVSDSSDPLGITSFATHHLPLEQAPDGYEIFRNKPMAASRSCSTPDHPGRPPSLTPLAGARR